MTTLQQTSLGTVNGYYRGGDQQPEGREERSSSRGTLRKKGLRFLNEDLRDNMIKAQFFGMEMEGPVMTT